MSSSKRIFVYEIPSIPDCTHHRLVTLCGGNVKEKIFQAFEHLLRMITNFKEGQLAVAFRFVFNPDKTRGLQNRLRLQLLIKIDEKLSENTVRQLIEAGPLAEFYEFTPESNAEDIFKYDFTSVSEVIRQEAAVEPLIPKEVNPNIPSIYYSLYPLEARDNNDFLMIDTLLSKMNEPCVIELLVSPGNQKHELEVHYRYVTRLMSINQYGDDFHDETDAISPYQEHNFQETSLMALPKKRDPIADEISHEQQEIHRILRQPQLFFNIKVFAMRSEQSVMLASAIAESGITEGKYRIISCNKSDESSNSETIKRSIDDSKNLNLSSNFMYSEIWDRDLPEKWKSLSRLCRLATVNELKGIMRLPVGGYGSPRCIRKNTDPEDKYFKRGKPVESNNKDDTLISRPKSILIGYDLESSNPTPHKIDLSNLKDEFQYGKSNNLETRLSLMNFAKHVFISGVPGSGKTTAVFNILVQLFQHGIPFLIIEPAKTEYRILKTLKNHPDPYIRDMAEKIRIFTPGNDGISPFRFNPLAYPDGITLDEHISQILASFEAAMPMGGPLQALIAEAVEEVYEGGNNIDFPEMTDLLDAARRIMERKNYEGEVKSNLKAAIEVRLGLITRRAMGRIFQTKKTIPSVKELLEYPAIIEMDYLSQDHACLLTLFLLSAMREQIKVDPNRRVKGLHHVTVIEEAHNIVGRTGNAKASEEVADPKAFAASYVSRMLAELRALGEGIVISDQLPSTVASEVVKNTGTKIAHRLVSKEDREDLGYAMLLGETEIEEIARLMPGEAYFYTEGLYKPRRVQCLNTNEYLQLNEIPDKEMLGKLVMDDEWFTRCKKEKLSELRKTISITMDDARIAVSRFENRLSFISERYQKLWDEKNSNSDFNMANNDISEDLNRIIIEFDDIFNKFRLRFNQINSGLDGDNGALAKAISSILNRWDETLNPEFIRLREEFINLDNKISRMLE